MVRKKSLKGRTADFLKTRFKSRPRMIAVLTLASSVLMLALILLYGKYTDLKAAYYMPYLSNENPMVQQNALRKIAKAKDTAKITNRIALLFYDDSRIRAVIVDKSIGCLQSQNADTVSETLKMMGKIRDKKAVPFLINVLNEKKTADKDTVKGALEALGRIKDPSAIQAISSFLRSEEQIVRVYAVWALGNIGDKKAIPLLLPLLRDNDKYVCYQAFVALNKIG